MPILKERRFNNQEKYRIKLALGAAAVLALSAGMVWYDIAYRPRGMIGLIGIMFGFFFLYCIADAWRRAR